MATKFYTKEKEINGIKYVAQFNGLSFALRAVDENYIEGTSNVSNERLAQYILDKVIVEPKGLQIDDFETMEELNEVTEFGRDVMQGKFRPDKDEKRSK